MVSENSTIADVNLFKTYALAYLKKGLSVIPVDRDKKPMIMWKEFQTRLPTEQEVTDWWTKLPFANIGVITGKISGIAVVDVEKDGDISKFPKTLTVKTGGGGRHFYYRYVEGCENKTRILPLTDVRGEGGYVVCPPSIHANKQKYEVIEDRPLADFPLWLFEIRKQNNWQDYVSGVQQGSRNDIATKLVGKLLRAFHFSEWETAVWPILRKWNESNSPPMSEYELRTIFKSIASRETKARNGEISSQVEFIPFTKVLEEGIKELDETKEEDVISFGYDWLDKQLVGFFPSELVVVGGETGAGKTSFVTNIFYKASKNYKCGIFALEDRLADYSIKALYYEIGKIRHKLGLKNYWWNDYRKNAIKDKDYFTYRNQAFERLKNENLFFARVNVQMNIDLLEKAIEEKIPEGYQMFLIDHLHYFDFAKGDDTKADYIEKLMVRLRRFQIRTGARIMMVVHYKKLEGKKPRLDSFKDSISIAQNANYLINIWRERDDTADRYTTTFSLPKVRNPNGEGSIKVNYNPVTGDYNPITDWTFGTEEDGKYTPIAELNF